MRKGKFRKKWEGYFSVFGFPSLAQTLALAAHMINEMNVLSALRKKSEMFLFFAFII